MTKPMRLLARDAEDMAVIAACLQDAIVPIGEMTFEPAARRFALVANRFKWESVDGGGRDGAATMVADDDHLFPYERVHSGVRFENVMGAKVRGIDLKDRHQMLSLLDIAMGEVSVTLTFAGGGALRLEGAGLTCVLEDLGEPWPTANRPDHGPDHGPDKESDPPIGVA